MNFAGVVGSGAGLYHLLVHKICPLHYLLREVLFVQRQHLIYLAGKELQINDVFLNRSAINLSLFEPD